MFSSVALLAGLEAGAFGGNKGHSHALTVLLHALQYIFAVRNATCATCTPMVFLSNTTWVVLTGLKGSTTYNVSVVGVDRAGRRTPSSNVMQTTTPQGNPGLATRPPPSPAPPVSRCVGRWDDALVGLYWCSERGREPHCTSLVARRRQTTLLS